jgi:hypothetical protein
MDVFAQHLCVGPWSKSKTHWFVYFLQPDLDIDYLITSVAMRLGGYLFPRTIHSVAPSTRLDDLLHPDLRVSGGNGLCKAEVKSQIDLSEGFLIQMLV